MKELILSFDKDCPAKVNEKIIIKAVGEEKNLFCKFLIGLEGIWNTIQDFSKKRTCEWIPNKEGKYTIMLQVKNGKSEKPFDYMVKEDYIIGNGEKLSLIKEVIISESKVNIGEKINIQVIGREELLLYRFWLRGKQGYEPIVDYTTNNNLVYTTKEEGNQEILIECKKLNSKESFDEFTTVKFQVDLPRKTQIVNFRCLTENIIVNEELVFKVDATLSNNRNLLYKFIKVKKNGGGVCIQDYSSRRVVCFKEQEPGEYQLLCLVKDMLSNEEYDDRALIYYKVNPYKKVKIKSFRSDLYSPQLKGSNINLCSNVSGGRKLVYRYIIEGPICEDSGYIRSEKYSWEPKLEGEYNITLFTKDISNKSEYEDKRNFKYIINKRAEKSVKIKDVQIDNSKKILIGQPVNIKVSAIGGADLRYSFIVYKNNIEKFRVDYSQCNWTTFIPDELGEYEIDINIKDKYSSREYDVNTLIHVRVKDYLPADIDYIVLPHKENYIVNDIIQIEAITEDSKDTLFRYITKINGYVVEDTNYIENTKLQIKPLRPGKYSFEIYSKNKKCNKEFDEKKEISFYVSDCMPVTNTKIIPNKEIVSVNEEITFKVNSDGGKGVCYQFYVMENGNWIKAQEYSRKDYYTFIPFLKGRYKVMVMAKSYYKKVNYEDYDEVVFEVS